MDSSAVVLSYLEEATKVFEKWTGETSSIDGDARDREPIIAIAAMLQAEKNK